VQPPDLVHVLYGDEQLDLLIRRRKLLRCPLIATFHLPAERVARRFEHFQSKEINGIDAAIVLARSEIAKFQSWFGTDKVVYIPHGIDTTQFRPDGREIICDTLKLLIVGDHMRDWDVLHRVIDETSRSNLDVQFDVVVRTPFFPYFTGCSNVTLHSGISEPKLIELYRRADALFLPVENAVASNAALEGLACGTPVIATDVGGMADYVNNDCGWLIPKADVAYCVELIKQLCLHKDLTRSRRDKARAHALKFDWQRIAEQLFVIYSAVRAGRSPSAAVKQFEHTQIGAWTAARFERTGSVAQ
jgi:glycosyltransferase involved in cell wall biosynthesis